MVLQYPEEEAKVKRSTKKTILKLAILQYVLDWSWSVLIIAIQIYRKNEKVQQREYRYNKEYKPPKFSILYAPAAGEHQAQYV